MFERSVLLDSDVFVAWFEEHDAHHSTVVHAFDTIKQQQLSPIATNLVIAETATLFSNRSSQTKAIRFLEFAQQIPLIIIDQSLHQRAASLMMGQTRKRTSFVDMANVAVVQHHNIPHLFSFDKVYRKDFGLKTFLLEIDFGLSML